MKTINVTQCYDCLFYDMEYMSCHVDGKVDPTPFNLPKNCPCIGGIAVIAIASKENSDENV